MEYDMLVALHAPQSYCKKLNLKWVIPAKQFHPHKPCVKPNQEIQIAFGGPIFDEKGNEVYFLAAIDHFSNHPTACIYDKAKGPNVLKFLKKHIENGVPRSIRLDKAKCLVGNQVKTFCYNIIKKNIDIIETPVNDHRAIGLVERLIQTIKNRLACIKEENWSTNAIYVKHALKIIIHQSRICKQKTAKISPFDAHFGRKPNTPLSMISTKPKLSNLTYENIVNYYLDEQTVMPEEILADDKWVNEYRSDIEGVKIGMTRASQEPKNRDRTSTDSETRFLRTKFTRPIPLKERAVELKVARKIHSKRRSKKILEGLYEVPAPGSHILKVSPTTSTIKEPWLQLEIVT